MRTILRDIKNRSSMPAMIITLSACAGSSDTSVDDEVDTDIDLTASNSETIHVSVRE